MFQHGVLRVKITSSEGTAEGRRRPARPFGGTFETQRTFRHFSRPFGAYPPANGNPMLKHWAIVVQSLRDGEDTGEGAAKLIHVLVFLEGSRSLSVETARLR